MPTYEATPRFNADHRRRFRQAVAAFVDDLRSGTFRAGLRETRGFAESGTGVTTNPAACPPLKAARRAGSTSR